SDSEYNQDSNNPHRPDHRQNSVTVAHWLSRARQRATKIYRPNSRSISQPSRPAPASGRTAVRVGAARLVPLAGNGASGADAVGAAEGALTCEATCASFEKKPPACEFGKAATGTPWWAARMNRVQTSTGNPPPVVFLVGELSSLPSQTPVTRLAV